MVCLLAVEVVRGEEVAIVTGVVAEVAFVVVAVFVAVGVVVAAVMRPVGSNAVVEQFAGCVAVAVAGQEMNSI